MPNLSARFSMLREQDDPTSKIGKANDDSVLFPKRASRLDLFNRKGLSDIAEVDSARGSIRPPFAQTRTESYGSGGYDTDEGGVMSRSRPGEGNTMFGGRQKIYKIPLGGSGSVKNFNAEGGDLPTGGNMGGKALYEEDTAPSAFQKLREQERQQERQERERTGQDHLRSPHDQDRSGSPPLAKYNLNRETSSSTNSGPSQPRTSTAATSVASQRSAFETINGASSTQPSSAGSDRPGPKGRRMYGQGLDQHMHEQQSSALQRLASLQTQRSTAAGSGTPRDLIAARRQSRSASNLHDRYQRPGPLYASNGFRAASPAPSSTPPKMQVFDLGLNDHNGTIPTDSGYGRSPPLSPPMSPTKDINGSGPLVASLEPNDLGKATASGAFNKPKVMYNEQQYLQRQLQLQEGRGTPSPQLTRPFSPQALSIDEHTTSQSRNNSLGSQFSRTDSFRQPWEHHMEDRVLRPVQERGSGTNSPSVRQSEDRNDRSFLAGMSGSDVDSQRENESEPNSPMTPATKSRGFSQPMPPQSIPNEIKQQLNFNPEHNHLSPSEPAEEAASDSRSYRSGSTITKQQPEPPLENTNGLGMDADSSTLGPMEVSNGLSGLVREHLRKQSDQSSIYPEDSPTINRFSDVRQSIFGHESALQSHSRNQSRDEAEADRQYWARQNRESDQSSVAAPPPLSFAARHILEQATALRNNHDNPKAQQMLGTDKAQRILGGEAPRTNSSHARSNSATWQEQLKAHHSRGASTETQKEREDLANELAERRRMVQDNLRIYAESNSRSASPGPGAQTQDHSPAKGHPFGLLKKSSKPSLAGSQQQQERPSKAMKMLGISPGSGPGPMPDAAQPPPDMFLGREQLSDRAMPPKQRLPPQPLTQPSRPQDVRQHSDTPPSSFNRQRDPVGVFRSQEDLAHHRHSPRSSKSASSNPNKSDRRIPESRKVNGIGSRRPNMEQGRVNGFSPNGAAAVPKPANQNNSSAPRSTNELVASLNGHGQPPAERSQSAVSGRFRSRSNSRTTATRTPDYFQPRVAPPNAPFMINPAGRSSKNAYPRSASTTPSVNGSRPSFASSSPTMFPPHSAPTSSHGHRSGHGGRKRSVTKHEISEPTLLSCTSSVDVVNLPPEASLRNGMDSPPSPTKAAPPIPVRDSRRKRTQTLLQALGRIQSPEPSPAKRDYPPSPYDENGDVQSTFSADDDKERPDRRTMRRLRKTSSEGGNMNKMAREKIMQSRSQSQVSSPAVPNFPIGAREMQKSPTVTGVEDGIGGHFSYQARQDVPASAVMF